MVLNRPSGPGTFSDSADTASENHDMDEANLARLTPSIDETIVATRRLPRMSISRVGPLDVICVLLVGTYLSVVFVFLLLTKRLRPEASLRRIARAAFRRRQSG